VSGARTLMISARARRWRRYTCCGAGHMVGVAQLVEHRVVVPGVAGSSPVTHPTRSSLLPARRWEILDHYENRVLIKRVSRPPSFPEWCRGRAAGRPGRRRE
jgi:hypothetical protein